MDVLIEWYILIIMKFDNYIKQLVDGATIFKKNIIVCTYNLFCTVL